MSGETTIALTSPQHGFLPRLVAGLLELEAAGLPAHALVGGVAVMVRLAQAHGATSDVDEVVLPSTPSAAELLIGGPAGPGQRVVIGDDVAVDLIPIGDRALNDLAAEELPDDDTDRVFVLAHDFALRTAERVRLQIFDPGGGKLVECRTPVATGPALFATKMQSTVARTGAVLSVKRPPASVPSRLIYRSLPTCCLHT